MGRTKSAEQEKAEFLRAAETMYEELHAWRDKHLDASFDEIADQVTPQRRKLVAKLLEQLAVKADERGPGGSPAPSKKQNLSLNIRRDFALFLPLRRAAGTGLTLCEQCGEKMRYRGTPERDVSHREGDVEVARAYYYCDSCERGLFPPRPATAVK